MPVFAISLFAIVSLIGATLALSMDSRSANNLQITADTAALGGATAFLNHKSPKAEDRLAAAKLQAEALATENSEFALVDLDVQAITEDAYGQHTRLAVELEFKPVNVMAGVTGRNASVEMRRRAVAEATWGFPLCMLALADEKDGFSVKHIARFIAPDCLVWSNAPRNNSMKFEGGVTQARYLCGAGRIRKHITASVTPSPIENCDIIPDPLANWVPPTPSVCKPDPDFPPRTGLLGGLPDLEINGDEEYEATGGDGMIFQWDDLALTDNLPTSVYFLDRQYNYPTDTISPGTYCGLTIRGGHVLMEPGTYFIQGDPMEISRKATVTAEGVTIIFTGAGSYLRVNDQARFRLTAPTSGDLAGFALSETRDTSSKKGKKAVVSRLTGAGRLSMVGLIYLPTQNFMVSGAGAGSQSSPLLQIVANEISLRDSGLLKIDFKPGQTSVPVLIAPSREARLVE